MIETETLQKLKGKKNLLAFSAGGDSSALFFLLHEQDITFDIAIVNYGLRVQSKDEVSYAKELASKYHIKCHLLNAQKIEQNFEAKAREIRYDFFEKLILENNYENLITAHHLGDRFEWMLMQFCKGAGCVELSGMKKFETRDNYTLIRPLLHVEKEQLLEYLKTKNIKYFEDETNQDESIKRNSFRHNYTKPLLKQYLLGIKKSFEYLDEDRDSLVHDIEVQTVDEFAYFKIQNIRTNIYLIDKYLKSELYMLSSHERALLKHNSTLVVGRKFVINQNDKFVFITPFINELNMSKEFKEKMRILKIEPKLRQYFYKYQNSFLKLKELFSSI